MDSWLWVGGALLLGLILGAGAAVWWVRRNMGDQESVTRLRKEFDGYKREVGEHFVHTAELVNDLTRSYKAVYDHLESGAYRLVGEEDLRKKLEGVETEPVKLEYIGRRDQTSVLGSEIGLPEAERRVEEAPPSDSPAADSWDEGTGAGGPEPGEPDDTGHIERERAGEPGTDGTEPEEGTRTAR